MFAEHLCIKGPLVAVPVSILGPKVQDIKTFNFLKSKWSLCSQDTIGYPRRDPDLSLDSQPPIQTSSGANFVCAECDAVFSEEGPYIARYHLKEQHQLTGASANKRLILPDRLLVARCICSFTVWTDASHFKQELRPHREGEHRDTRTPLNKLFSVECRVCDFHLESLPLSGSSLSEHVASHSDEYHPPLPAVAVVVNSSLVSSGDGFHGKAIDNDGPSRDRRRSANGDDSKRSCPRQASNGVSSRRPSRQADDDYQTRGLPQYHDKAEPSRDRRKTVRLSSDTNKKRNKAEPSRDRYKTVPDSSDTNEKRNKAEPPRDRRKTVRDKSDTNGKSAQIAATVSMKNDIESMFAVFYEARSVCPALLEDLIHAAVDISEGLRQPTAVGSPDQSRGE
jgi:hypothetical protein